MFLCVRHGSSRAEKRTNVSPWSTDLSAYTQTQHLPRTNPIDATQPLGSPRTSAPATAAAAAAAHRPTIKTRPPVPILSGFGNRGDRGARAGANGAEAANGGGGGGGGGAGGGGAGGGGGAAGGGGGGGREVHYSEPLKGGPLSPLSRAGGRSPSLGRAFKFSTHAYSHLSSYICSLGQQ